MFHLGSKIEVKVPLHASSLPFISLTLLLIHLSPTLQALRMIHQSFLNRFSLHLDGPRAGYSAGKRGTCNSNVVHVYMCWRV